MKKENFVRYLENLADTLTNLAEEIEVGETNLITLMHVDLTMLNEYLNSDGTLED